MSPQDKINLKVISDQIQQDLNAMLIHLYNGKEVEEYLKNYKNIVTQVPFEYNPSQLRKQKSKDTPNYLRLIFVDKIGEIMG